LAALPQDYSRSHQRATLDIRERSPQHDTT
jgi:hypothetical protein